MPAETPVSQQNGTGAPRATLLCRPNSHPFNDRNLQLDQEIKIGRSVARAKPTLNNAIFDCKVLSRNHAVLWYSLGKFYLQDTKSSNGTFVNNQRLSKGTEESAPREVCSGDILQFGVDVMENSRKVTHGCIIATLKLFLPDGKEAKASPSIVNSTSLSSIPPQDLYQLNTYIQESLAREQMLETKLLNLQKIVNDTENASKSGWRALMDEDRLLTRVEILESQLSTYGKSMGEDKLREETKKLMEDKEAYQLAAKLNIKKLVDDRLECVNKMKISETSLINLETEFKSMKSLYNNILEENKKLTERISLLQEEVNKRAKKEEEEEEELNKDLYIENAISELIIENGSTLLNGGRGEKNDSSREEEEEDEFNLTDRMISSTDSLDGSKPDGEDEDHDILQGENSLQISSLDVSGLNEANRLRGLVEDLIRTRERNETEISSLKDALREARTDNSVVLQDLNNTKNKLEDAERLIETQDSLVREMEVRVQENSNREGGRGREPDLVELNLKISNLEEENYLLKEKLRDNEIKDGVAYGSYVPMYSTSGTLESCVLGGNHVETLKPAKNRVEQENPREESRFLNTHQLSASETNTDTIKPSSAKFDDSAHEEVSALDSSESALNISCSSCGDLSAVECALAAAEEKIAKLLRAKEKLISIQAEKSELEVEVNDLHEDIQALAVTSRTLTLCNILPLIALLLSVVVAFLPSISSILGTKDRL